MLPERTLSSRPEFQYHCHLRRLRVSKGLRQKRLAELTKINRCSLSLIEHDRLFLSSGYALRIREALGCTLGELYGLA